MLVRLSPSGNFGGRINYMYLYVTKLKQNIDPKMVEDPLEKLRNKMKSNNSTFDISVD